MVDQRDKFSNLINHILLTPFGFFPNGILKYFIIDFDWVCKLIYLVADRQGQGFFSPYLL